MGFELITQPQVFLAPITAVGGIQNGLLGDPLPPLYTSFYTWTSTSSVTATTFPLDGIETLTNRSGSYIVTVGGVVQSPTNYTVNPNTRLLTFDFNVNPNSEVIVTQIGTTVSLVSVANLSTTNSVLNNVQADRLLVTNLTALSAEFRVVDITQYELSGFEVRGDANISGNVNVTGSIVGATSATSITIGSLSSRIFDLIHSPANDGVDPIFNIGETDTLGFSGLRVRYEEPTNRIIISSRTGTTILTSAIIAVATGQVGISGLPAPGQALTVVGNVSASGNVSVGGNINTIGFVTSPNISGGNIYSQAPVTVTSTPFTVPTLASSIIYNNSTNTGVFTLPTASTNVGRWLYIRTVGAAAINSATANVVPLSSVTPINNILPQTGVAAVGKWTQLHSDGTNWITMAAN